MSLPGAGLSVRRVVISVVLVSVATVAGCSSNKQSATTSSNATTSTAVPAPGSTTLPAPTTSTTVPGCTGANYALSVLGSQGAAGTFEVTFGFRNTSSATCALTGYPGIQLLGAGGADLATNTVQGGGDSFTDFSPSTVELAGGATAYFNMGYSDVTTGTESSCPTTTALEATPPGTSTPLQVSGQYVVCNGGTVNVSPVFGQGSPETQTTAPPST
ncbi:MAG TPA: DUF4232 domain-containing protein [Acidimicrobiales bacterium]|nr:DUF4232 domain-containing protein [Acidimicrobiales bacterium]